MDRSERFYKICQRLGRGRPIPSKVFLDELEISRPTFFRDIEYLKARFNAPIEYDQSSRGYRYDPQASQFELPGIWFTSREAHALRAMQQLLNEMQPGLIQPLLQPLFVRLEKQFGKLDTTLDEVQRRIRILSIARREVEPNYFELISHAVLARKCMSMNFYNRGRDETSHREVSPQRLVHYRDNWYLDAYDHMRKDLRTFSLACIRDVRLIDTKARHISEQKLDSQLGKSYGIFAGEPTRTAVLLFTPYRARWVAEEQWHPQQHGKWQADGSYRLEIPYSDDRELLMDILKYGPDVEVLSPKELRTGVHELLIKAGKKYQK